MTTTTLRENAIHLTRIMMLAPILLAALIGAIPLIIPCVTCRCCKGIASRIMTAFRT